MKKIIWISLVVVIIGIQFIPANRPANSQDLSQDLISNNQIPENIQKILKNACYDCHSEQTEYRWYAYVAPVSFLVARDVKEGREHLNFTQWEKLDKSKKAKALDEMAEEVEEGDMPMPIYLITHPEAKLSDEDKKAFNEWTENFAEQLFE